MIIFDAHLDLAWNAVDWNRDLRLPVEEIRRLEREQGMTGKGRGVGTVSFPALRKGKVAIFIATLLARQLRSTGLTAVHRYSSMPAAYAAAYGQLAYYRAMEQEGVLRWIRDRPALEAHLSAWKTEENRQQPLGFILSMEGADPVLAPDQVQEWYDAGLRVIGPAHYGPSPYARGHNVEGGLFEQGPALLREMERVGMILDVTHLSDQCFYEALDIYGGPVLASHHNCRSLVNDPRQLTDDQIKRLIGRGAVIGAALDAWMMVSGWVRGQTTPEQAGVELEHVVDHIDGVCQLAGNARHAAIGTDLDGGFGREQSPLDLDTIADLQRLPELLRKRGYDEEAIEGIAHGNWVRFFREAWSR
ncbi:MAG TPA: membrane dipeptidase [Gemmataceae bacterium]|nr:membrane dipeptidase [Gemmataceae bacterium]